VNTSNEGRAPMQAPQEPPDSGMPSSAGRIVRPAKGSAVVPNLGKGIRATMDASSVKLEKVVKKSGLPEDRVNEILEGKTPTLEEFIDLSQGMDYTPGGLLNRIMRNAN